MPRALQAVAVNLAPHGWMARRRERYGDIFSSRFPVFGRVVYVADLPEVKRIFTGDPASFHAGEVTALALGDALGEHSLLTLDEDRHMSQRKLLLPAFHGERVRGYIDVMADATAAEVASWPRGGPFPLRPRMQAITLEVILRAVFGVRDGQRMDAFRASIPRLADATSVLSLLPLMDRELGGYSPAARFRRALAEVDAQIYDQIAHRRAELAGTPGEDQPERDDVLTLLLGARHEDGSPMSDTELRDQLVTLLTAGHETTATGLSWAFERLVRSPQVMKTLTERLDDDEYVDAVVQETLRIRPVVADVARRLTKDTEIGGYMLPRGTIVVLAIAAIHARPDLYPQPGEFRPERFLDGRAESYAWIPFGGGVRRCIGAAFAQVEMRIVLREVLRRVRLRAASPRPERASVAHVTAVPARGCRVIVEEFLEEPTAAGERDEARAAA